MDSKTLMHPREAQNHKDSGFFPTDDDTMKGIIALLKPNEGQVNVLDPCCGKGHAVRHFYNIFSNAKIHGIELDRERSQVAKKSIDYSYHSDINYVQIGRGNFDCLFLNPPYGNVLSDKFLAEKSERLEQQFLSKTFTTLKTGGVLIYIVPKKSLYVSAKWLISRFSDIRIYEAAVDTYKQVVFVAKKLKVPRAAPTDLVTKFEKQLNNLSKLPHQNEEQNTYSVPQSNFSAKIIITTFDAEAALSLKLRYKGQWPIFNTLFSSKNESKFSLPLHALANWHLALLITSGAIQGKVTNKNQTLLVKGNVRKRKKITEATECNDTNNEVTITTEAKDYFEAVIKAVDLTKGSSSFGEIFTIR